MKYEMKKVFDCQDMPPDVRTYFFELHEASNDTYVSHEVFAPTFLDEADDGTEQILPCEDYSIVDAWLLENGAFVGEYVLINHWW